MLDIEVIEQPEAAVTALDPVRSRLLAELSTPASAAELAERLAQPRQRLTYHLRALERHGLVREAETRAWGGITERRYVATAHSYVVSPAALGPAANDPARTRDRLSAGYLVALASRAVREVAALWRKALGQQKQLATLSLDTEVRFASPDARAAFTAELTQAVTDLVARYHDPNAEGGRWHRLVAFAHPHPETPAPASS